MNAIMKIRQENSTSCLRTMIDILPQMTRTDWRSANRDFALRGRIFEECQALVEAAAAGEAAQCEAIHDILRIIYDREFQVARVDQQATGAQHILTDIAAVFEEALLARETGGMGDAASDHPGRGVEYVHWLKRLISDHRASQHPYYHRFMQDHATRDDLRYLLAQETCIDPRFDDILALIQLRARGGAKLEIAANYWDEMGNGQLADMHSILFEDALDDLAVDQAYIDQNYLFEAKACGNISAALALRHEHYFTAIGYFGVTEYLAPRRFRTLVSAWKRLGLPAKGMHYHDLHVGVDAGHAAGWFKNVIQPAIDHDPCVGHDIATGALIRLNTSERYLDALLARTGFVCLSSNLEMKSWC